LKGKKTKKPKHTLDTHQGKTLIDD